jgi:hypothetical protein
MPNIHYKGGTDLVVLFALPSVLPLGDLVYSEFSSERKRTILLAVMQPPIIMILVISVLPL